MESKKNRSQAKSIGLVAIVNIVNAVIGVAQAFIVGRLFGTSPGIEIFFAASAISLSMSKLLQAGQIAEIFTPIYHKLKKSDGAAAAFELQAVLLNWILVTTALLALVMVFAAHLLIPFTVRGFPTDRMETCVMMFQILAPLIVVQVAQFMLATLLINEKYFVAREVTRTISQVASLLTILIFARFFDAWTMVAALWANNVITFVIFLFLIMRMGYRHSFRFSHESFPISEIFRKLPSVFGYVCVSQIYTLVLTGALSVLPQGMLAVYTYAGRLYARVSGILVRPVSTVFFSHFSSAAAEGDVKIQGLTIKALRLILLLSTVTCVLTITAGLPILRALWLSPVFPASRIWLTYITFCAFCFIPIFSGLALIYRKINMVHQYTHSQYLILIANQIISIALAYYLIPLWGLFGVIFVLIAAVVFSAVASGTLLRRTYRERLAIYDWTTVKQCCILFGITVPLLLLLQHATGFYQVLPNSLIGHVLAAAILGSLAMGIMVTLAHFLGVTEFRAAMSRLQRSMTGLLGSR